jgi:5-methyltetrahydropteroyltriglutamate--homocysteine methyltransferase
LIATSGDDWIARLRGRSSLSQNTRTIMPRTKPPFRADHVGSLLRPAVLKQARAKRERGEITAEELETIEDREIEAVIRKQEDAGLRSVTDGEFRRAFWNYDFLGQLDGVEAYLGERKIKFQGPQPKPMMLRVIGKVGGYRAHPMIEHFKFVAAHAKATPKMTVPSPSSLHFRYGRDAVPVEIYPDMDDFYRDLGEGYRKALRAFSDAGCRYLPQFHLSLRPQAARLRRQPRRGSGNASPRLCPHDQRRAVGSRARCNQGDASVPRQLPIDLRRVRRLRAGG